MTSLICPAFISWDNVPHRTFLTALQVSSAHVYLTYPFVLSWSMLEAMSAGCLVIGSDTAPVREVIEPDHNGILVPFFAVNELAERVVEALQNPAKFVPMRQAARQYVIEHFDAERICVPQMRRLLQQEQEGPAQPEIPGKPRHALPIGCQHPPRRMSRSSQRKTGCAIHLLDVKRSPAELRAIRSWDGRGPSQAERPRARSSCALSNAAKRRRISFSSFSLAIVDATSPFLEGAPCLPKEIGYLEFM